MVRFRKEPIQLQALSEEDRRHWLDVMDGQEPVRSYILVIIYLLIHLATYLVICSAIYSVTYSPFIFSIMLIR